MRAAPDILKGDRNGGSLFKGCEKILVAVNVARQLVHRNVRQLLSLGLGNVKDRYHLVGGYLDFLFLGDGLPVLADYGLLRVWVYLLHFLSDFERRRGNDFNSLLPFHHVTPEIILPSGKARHKGSVRLLHGDKQRIVEAVIMEF